MKNVCCDNIEQKSSCGDIKVGLSWDVISLRKEFIFDAFVYFITDAINRKFAAIDCIQSSFIIIIIMITALSVNLSTGSTQHCRTVFVWDPFLDSFVHHLNRPLLLLLLMMMMMTSRCRCLLRPHRHCTALWNSQSSWEPIEDDWMTFDILLNAVTTQLIVLARKTLQRPRITAELNRPRIYRILSTWIVWTGLCGGVNKLGGNRYIVAAV